MWRKKSWYGASERERWMPTRAGAADPARMHRGRQAQVSGDILVREDPDVTLRAPNTDS